MKKTTSLVAFALFVATTTFAQTGSILVSGDLSLQNTKYPGIGGNSSESEFIFTISPLVGYQFSSAWTAGLVMGYSHFQTKNLTYPSPTTNSYSIGPFVRYTRMLTSWVSLYGQFQATREDDGKIAQDANGVAQDQYVGDIKLFPALFFNVKNGFGINVSFGGLEGNFTHVHNVGTIQENLNLTFGNSALIGISKNFGGHHKAA